MYSAISLILYALNVIQAIHQLRLCVSSMAHFHVDFVCSLEEFSGDDGGNDLL